MSAEIINHVGYSVCSPPVEVGSKNRDWLGTGQAQDGLGQAQPQIEPTGNELGKDLITS